MSDAEDEEEVLSLSTSEEVAEQQHTYDEEESAYQEQDDGVDQDNEQQDDADVQQQTLDVAAEHELAGLEAAASVEAATEQQYQATHAVEHNATFENSVPRQHHQQLQHRTEQQVLPNGNARLPIEHRLGGRGTTGRAPHEWAARGGRSSDRGALATQFVGDQHMAQQHAAQHHQVRVPFLTARGSAGGAMPTDMAQHAAGMQYGMIAADAMQQQHQQRMFQYLPQHMALPPSGGWQQQQVLSPAGHSMLQQQLLHPRMVSPRTPGGARAPASQLAQLQQQQWMQQHERWPTGGPYPGAPAQDHQQQQPWRRQQQQQGPPTGPRQAATAAAGRSKSYGGPALGFGMQPQAAAYPGPPSVGCLQAAAAAAGIDGAAADDDVDEPLFDAEDLEAAAAARASAFYGGDEFDEAWAADNTLKGSGGSGGPDGLVRSHSGGGLSAADQQAGQFGSTAAAGGGPLRLGSNKWVRPGLQTQKSAGAAAASGEVQQTPAAEIPTQAAAAAAGGDPTAALQLKKQGSGGVPAGVKSAGAVKSYADVPAASAAKPASAAAKDKLLQTQQEAIEQVKKMIQLMEAKKKKAKKGAAAAGGGDTAAAAGTAERTGSGTLPAPTAAAAGANAAVAKQSPPAASANVEEQQLKQQQPAAWQEQQQRGSTGSKRQHHAAEAADVAVAAGDEHGGARAVKKQRPSTEQAAAEEAALVADAPATADTQHQGQQHHEEDDGQQAATVQLSHAPARLAVRTKSQQLEQQPISLHTASGKQPTTSPRVAAAHAAGVKRGGLQIALAAAAAAAHDASRPARRSAATAAASRQARGKLRSLVAVEDLEPEAGTTAAAVAADLNGAVEQGAVAAGVQLQPASRQGLPATADGTGADSAIAAAAPAGLDKRHTEDLTALPEQNDAHIGAEAAAAVGSAGQPGNSSKAIRGRSPEAQGQQSNGGAQVARSHSLDQQEQQQQQHRLPLRRGSSSGLEQKQHRRNRSRSRSRSADRGRHNSRDSRSKCSSSSSSRSRSPSRSSRSRSADERKQLRRSSRKDEKHKRKHSKHKHSSSGKHKKKRERSSKDHKKQRRASGKE